MLEINQASHEACCYIFLNNVPPLACRRGRWRIDALSVVAHISKSKHHQTCGVLCFDIALREDSPVEIYWMCTSPEGRSLIV